MYFYLAKIVGFFALPSNFISLVLMCGLLLWPTRYTRLGRRTAVAGIFLFLIAGMTPLGTALLVPLENRFPRWNPAQGSPDGIIILGGVVNTYISQHRHDISLDAAAERLIAVIGLAHQYPNARILFSGGNSNLFFPGVPESILAVRFLEQHGVPSDRILIDRNSRNTRENAVNAKEVAGAKPGQRWLLVTSASHMPRAVGLFRAAGFPVEAYPVDWKTGGWNDLRAFPNSLLYGIPRLDLAVHEWEGLFVDWAVGRSLALFPGPTDTDVAK